MIWLASFPRSGNTFLRNVLSEVYGIESSTYHQEDHPLDERYHEYPFVKTHLLPEQLPHGKNIPAVYLVRDGRDALISLAHHRSDIIAPGTDLLANLKEAILAAEGSYFGGWSNNVEAWLKRADLVIRFEDLVRDPIGQIERIRTIYPQLPVPDSSKLPTFESQKFGTPRYGSGTKISPDDSQKASEITGQWFRKGKMNGWKDEFPEDLHRLFWSYHRITMERMGYTFTGEPGSPHPELDSDVLKKTGAASVPSLKKTSVLIEANKLLMHRNDGIKRYVSELLKAFYPLSQHPDSAWQIDLFIDGSIRPLAQCHDILFDPSQNENREEVQRSTLRTIIHYSKQTAKQLLPEQLYERSAITFKKALMKFRLKTGRDAINKSSKLSAGADTPAYDLIHVPLLQHYEPFTGLKGPFAVTLHDLTHRQFPEFHTRRNVELAEQGLQFFINKKSHVITISESTREAMNETPGLNASAAITVPEAADPKKFRPLFNPHYAALTRRFYNIPEDVPFLLTVSTLEPRKNLLHTINAFERLLEEHPEQNAMLVIAGPSGWKTKELKQVRHRDRILFTGFIDEHHLPVLYNEAVALCYVSRYEGFGLPVLEAMSCGTPVIFGNNSSMKEYFSGYGLAADADDVIGISRHMFRLLSDPACRAEYAVKALTRSFDFSWRNSAIGTLNAYREFTGRT